MANPLGLVLELAIAEAGDVQPGHGPSSDFSPAPIASPHIISSAEHMSSPPGASDLLSQETFAQAQVLPVLCLGNPD